MSRKEEVVEEHLEALVGVETQDPKCHTMKY
jgi:hypothetical protein